MDAIPPSHSALEGSTAGEENRLIARLAGGEDSALRELYQRFAAPLFSMVFRILGDAAESEDVIQETFVQIWKKAGTFDASRGNAFSWAVRIARNRAIDRIRSRQRQTRLVEGLTNEVSPEVTEEMAPVEQRDERSHIHAALAKLPAEQREALELAFFNGLTHPEVSDQLQTPLGTIKARIRRGLLALREGLKRS